MTMSPKMQEAAVKAALGEGASLDAVAKSNPELAAGIKLVREEQERQNAPRRRGSGSTSPTYLNQRRI